jgi:hypothetical protein
VTTDHRRLAAGLAALKAAATGTPMLDRLNRWVIEGGDGDPALLLGLAAAEAKNGACPRCGFDRSADLLTDVQNAVLDRLLDKHQSEDKVTP